MDLFTFAQVAEHLIPPKLAKFSRQIGGACMSTGVEPILLSAVLWHESTGDPKALSFDGQNGMGLGQIDKRSHPTFCAARWGQTNELLVFRPSFNALYSAEVLADNLRFFKGEVWPAVAAYNAGPTKVARALAALDKEASAVERIAAVNTATHKGVYVTKVKAHYDLFNAKELELERNRKGSNRVS